MCMRNNLLSFSCKIVWTKNLQKYYILLRFTNLYYNTPHYDIYDSIKYKAKLYENFIIHECIYFIIKSISHHIYCDLLKRIYFSLRCRCRYIFVYLWVCIFCWWKKSLAYIFRLFSLELWKKKKFFYLCIRFIQPLKILLNTHFFPSTLMP